MTMNFTVFVEHTGVPIDRKCRAWCYPAGLDITEFLSEEEMTREVADHFLSVEHLSEGDVRVNITFEYRERRP